MLTLFNPKHLLFFAFMQLAVGYLAAQNETSKWYFGSGAAMDFAGSGPVGIVNSAMFTGEGSASIADGAGNLLFYTQGTTIWNANHLAMPNGTGLFGSSISCQSAVIVRQPGSTTLYYVFTMRNWTDGGNGAHFSIVDMSLASGLGDVTTKNQLIYANTRESLTAVCHSNGIDYWIVLHDMFTNEFKSYLLTSTGLAAVPVTSAVGSVFTGGNRYGALKSSPDNLRLAYALGGGSPSTEAYDFDRTTGLVSNPITLNNGLFTNAYGVDFSPNSQVLYVAEYNGSTIQQFNLAAGSPAAILASNTVISTGANRKANLQLGPDNRIYVCLAYQTFMGQINNPNTVGVGCNYVNNSVDLLGRSNGIGIPNFMPCLIPVVLSSPQVQLFAANHGASVRLNWVGMPDQIRRVAVERQHGLETSFSFIGEISALAISEGLSSWLDPAPRPGQNSYRLAMQFANGEVSYSEVAIAELPADRPTLHLAPNPARSSFELESFFPTNEACELRILDVQGKVVLQYEWLTNAKLVLACDAWLPGVYFVEVRSVSGTQRKSLVHLE